MKTIHLENLGGKFKTDVHREIAGLSTETKPVTDFEGIPMRTGDMFLELDTGDVYGFSEDAASGSEWSQVCALGGSGS